MPRLEKLRSKEKSYLFHKMWTITPHFMEQKELYQVMYMNLAQIWLKQQVHLHLIGHFAHDILLRDTLYQLGFGAVVAERLRDCSTITAGQSLFIQRETATRLLDLHLEHIQHYSQSPIFLSRSADRALALQDLESHERDGDVAFAAHEGDDPCAYVIVGQVKKGGEGFLLRETNTAQMKAAYVRPGLRGKGIGAALLQHAIQWAKEQGYERVLVEHETANLAGRQFWQKYFEPYLYFSMRYIDNTL